MKKIKKETNFINVLKNIPDVAKFDNFKVNEKDYNQIKDELEICEQKKAAKEAEKAAKKAARKEAKAARADERRSKRSRKKISDCRGLFGQPCHTQTL